MQKYVLKYRKKCGFVDSDLEAIHDDPHVTVVDVFMNRALLLESSYERGELSERFGHDWIIASETTYALPSMGFDDDQAISTVADSV